MSKFSVSAAIMAHEKRAAFIPELEARLDREAKVVWDEKNDCWDTRSRAMRAYSSGASHHVVVQDDAIVCRDLIAGIERALVSLPEPDQTPIVLYIGTKRPLRGTMGIVAAEAESAGASWVKMTQIHWGVGIVFPVGMIDEMCSWCDGLAGVAADDGRMNRWVGKKHLDIYYPWPSLVDHRDSPSLIQDKGGEGRRAHRFIGEDNSALDQNWDGPVIELKSLNRSQADLDARRARRAAKRPSHTQWTRGQ